MLRGSCYYKVICAAALGIAFCGQPREVRSDTVSVAPGYDLFETMSGSNFPGLGDLMGVPLGNFDFGGAIGNKNLGNTDTIVQRLDAATVTAPGAIPFPVTAPTINLSVVALQLETVNMVNFGGNGLANYFVTLTPTVASTGTMDITFASAAGGTFASTLDLNLDIHKGSLNGAVVDSLTNVLLTNTGAGWGRIAPAGAVVINGVNFMLDGTDTNQDFWPVPPVIETHPGGGVHEVTNASVPEPSAWIMLLTAGLIVPAAYARRGLRRAGELVGH
jgi:hypothetical protein